jgi:hypothetical protein
MHCSSWGQKVIIPILFACFLLFFLKEIHHSFIHERLRAKLLQYMANSEVSVVKLQRY